MSAVSAYREHQEQQLAAVEGLERRAARLREMDEARDAEAREYAKEWVAAKKLDLPESRLTALDLPLPDAPARAKPNGSRSKKAGGRPEALGGASVSDAGVASAG